MSLPSISLDSDHRHVLAKLIMNKPQGQRRVMRERFCLERLKERETAEEFQLKISNLKPDENDIVQDIEIEWEDFKSKVITGAREAVHTQNNRRKKEEEYLMVE